MIDPEASDRCSCSSGSECARSYRLGLCTWIRCSPASRVLRTECSVLHWVQATTNFNSHGLSLQPLSTLLEDCIQPILDGIPLFRYPLPGVYMSMEKSVQYSVESREDGKYIPHADPQAHTSRVMGSGRDESRGTSGLPPTLVVLLLFYAYFFRLFLVSSWSQLS